VSPDTTNPGPLPRLAAWLGLGITLIVIVLAGDFQYYLALTILEEQAIALALALALSVVFLQIRASGARDRGPPVHDVVLAFVALVAGGWLAIRFQIVSSEFFEHRTEAFIIALVLIPLIFEALRRTAGWALMLILAAFMLYGLFGDLVPGKLEARTPGFFRLFAYLAADNVALLGLPLKIVVTIVVMFMIMGQLLARAGGSDWFTDISMSLIGRTRGGPAKIAVMASALFGSISGSAVSNVASTGLVTIPLMRRGGYSATSAAAFEAVASTGGQIMPPIMGAAAFLMAEFLEASYTEVIIAALVPALLYYVSVFVQADLEAARKNIAPIDPDQIEPLRKVLAAGWFFTIPFAVLIVALFEFNRTPSESALWASVVLLGVGLKGYKGKKISPRVVLDALKAAGQVSVSIIVIGAMAGLIIGVVERTGLGFGLTFVLIQVGEESLFLLLVLTGAVCLLLGMGMPTTAIYFLVAILAAPPLIKLGVNPFAAHLFVLYYGLLSLITPPVAIAAFTAANLAGAPPMRTAVAAVRYGWPAFVLPFAFVLSPALLLQGTTLEVARAVAAACMGIWVASLGFGGWFSRSLGLFVRGLLVLAGMAMLIPGAALGFPWLDLCGLVLAGLVMGREIVQKRRIIGQEN
jgi:TRAP transporter 4TM/12TM fusion protein